LLRQARELTAKKTVAFASTFLLGTLALSAAATGTPSTTLMSTAKTERVSVSSTGAQGNLPSWAEGISANGRYVVFSSGSAGLVPRDTNRRQDAFLRDRKTVRTTRVSVSSSGRQGKAARDPFGGSAAEAISAGGRYILFRSDAANLVSGDTNGSQDIFIRDRKTHRTTRVSVGSGGRQANGRSDFAVLSPNGRYVAFSSSATNLVPGDTNRAPDVFVRDRAKGTTQRVSVGARGRQANRESEQSAISADGRYVAFESGASNLVPGDTNATTDVFVRDRKTGRTTRVSVSSRGKQGTGDRTHNGSNGPSISADGRYVAFHSGASNLVPGDTNRTMDIFVHDRVTGNTQRVSVSSSGRQANGENIGAPRISADGRYVAFASLASNLVPRDVNDVTDAFLRDLRTDRTMLVSLNSRGAQGRDASVPNGLPAFSAGNRYLLFSSWAGLVPGDTNGTADAYVRDLRGTLGAARVSGLEPITARRPSPRARRWLTSSSSSWRSARWSRNARRCVSWARARTSWRRTRGVQKPSRVPNSADFQEDRISAPHGLFAPSRSSEVPFDVPCLCSRCG
jgi:Tol biopolymer transport system component